MESKTSSKERRPGGTSDPYYKWFQENCKSVDFRSFGGVKQQVLRYMKDKKCPVETKLLFGTWMLKTIYMMYKFRGPEKKDVADSLITPISECKNVIPKGEYLKYHDLEAMSMICLNFYLERFKDRDSFFILQLLNDTQLVKGYLQNANVDDEELLEHFLSWVERSPVNEQRSNILDVLLRYYPKDQRVKDLYDEMKFGKSKDKSVFNNAQNVHDEEINEAVLTAAENLMDWGLDEDEKGNLIHAIKIEPPATPNSWAESVLYSEFKDPNQRKIIDCCLQRCAIDTTTFGSGFMIADIFFTTIKYITLLPSDRQQSLFSVFMEEMDAMKELCASGYVARCMTVLQGQDESGDFDIVIPFSKKLHALLSMKITKDLEKANESVVLGTYDQDFKIYFLEYVSRIVNEYLPTLLKDNDEKDIVADICGILEKLTNNEWAIEKVDEKLTVVFKPLPVNEVDVEPPKLVEDTPSKDTESKDVIDEKLKMPMTLVQDFLPDEEL